MHRGSTEHPKPAIDASATNAQIPKTKSECISRDYPGAT